MIIRISFFQNDESLNDKVKVSPQNLTLRLRPGKPFYYSNKGFLTFQNILFALVLIRGDLSDLVFVKNLDMLF